MGKYMLRPQGKLNPHERMPLAAQRFVVREYALRGKAYYRQPYSDRYTLLARPLVIEIKRIECHECTLDKYNSYSCCWGMTHTITLQYSTSGYYTTMGARFDHNKDSWIFQVWMD